MSSCLGACIRIALLLVCSLSLMGGGDVRAQALDPLPPLEEKSAAEQALERARALYGAPEPEPVVPIECQRQRERTPDEIVVCARLEDAARYRVGSSLDDGDDSHLQWLGDAPDVAGPGIFRGKATVGGMCGTVLNPCPPQVYYFDVTALPEAPPGSDADRIAKGEMPDR